MENNSKTEEDVSHDTAEYEKKECESEFDDINTKKDETPNVSQTTQTLVESKILSDSKITQVRIIRSKKLKTDIADIGQVNDKKDNKEEDNTDAKVIRSYKRSCELWSMEDKNTFFKALNEYGKDFDALQSFFLSQGKKKGLADNMIKNKEQIRHFYYRTWLKISKHLKFSNDLKKTSQELYGLINYGELRRKLPRLHEKAHLKLNELVYWGSTQVRLRGKTMRIKTPICRALRKLNQLEDWQEEIKLPSRVTIELRPGNNMTWWQVQAASMNPRIRTLLPIQRRLSSLLTFLQQRWRPVKYKNYTNAENIVSPNIESNYLLRVAPAEGSKIALPVVNLGEYLTSNSVSLNSYEKRLGLASSKVDLFGPTQNIKGMGKKGIKKCKWDKKSSINLDDNCIPDSNCDVEISEQNSSICEKSINMTSTESGKSGVGQSTEPNRFPGRETIDRIKKGWNIDEANTITVGDLFLMFGRESKISLDYWWDLHPSEKSTDRASISSTSYDCNLQSALQKLLSLAKQSYGINKVYDNASGSNETVVSSRVPSTKDSTFRRPLLPQTYHKLDTANAFKTQLDKFKNRFCKRGRTVRQKSLVVQRVPSIVPDLLKPSQSPDVSDGTINILHDISLDDKNKKIDSLSIDQMNKIEEKHFLEAMEVVEESKPSNSIITSATQILKEGENQWLNSEVADFSLSSFLGQLESPIKTPQRIQTGEHITEVIRPPSDVVSQMQCLMGENSVDYMAKFANLASQIACDHNKK